MFDKFIEFLINLCFKKKKLNFYSRGDTTPYGQVLTFWNIPFMWDQLKQMVNYDAKLTAITQYNANNRWRKRGLSMVFFLSFTLTPSL